MHTVKAICRFHLSEAPAGLPNGLVEEGVEFTCESDEALVSAVELGLCKKPRGWKKFFEGLNAPESPEESKNTVQNDSTELTNSDLA